MSVPHVASLLPELTQFITLLVPRYQNGSIQDWQEFARQVRAFFTPAMMGKVEQVVPGWMQMSVYAEQQTLIHVTGVLTALQLLPEYRQAAPEQQSLMTWMVLFHDIAKIPVTGQHDYVHGFRSAAITVRGMVRAGFPVLETPDFIEQWAALTHNAVIFREDLQEYVQDNRKLPEIMSGIDRIFGVQAPIRFIVKGVLLHLSIATDPDYPTVAPLTDEEISLYIDTTFFPLLKMMMLVDGDGWNLFDPATRQRHRQQTLAVYHRIGARIGA